jgi:hypothetical protein
MRCWYWIGTCHLEGTSTVETVAITRVNITAVATDGSGFADGSGSRSNLYEVLSERAVVKTTSTDGAGIGSGCAEVEAVLQNSTVLIANSLVDASSSRGARLVPHLPNKVFRLWYLSGVLLRL